MTGWSTALWGDRSGGSGVDARDRQSAWRNWPTIILLATSARKPLPWVRNACYPGKQIEMGIRLILVGITACGKRLGRYAMSFIRSPIGDRILYWL